MVLKDLGIELSEAQLSKALGTTEQGAKVTNIPSTILELKLKIESNGFSILKFEDLVLALEKNPAIVSVTVPGKGAHAIVIDKIIEGQVYIRDPLPMGIGSSYSVSVSDFKNFYNFKGTTFQ